MIKARFGLWISLFLLLATACASPSGSPSHPAIDSGHVPVTTSTTESPNTPYLVVLGVAQDAGYPQIGCRKDCCKPVWENPRKRKKVVSLGLIDPISGERWMFEATPDFPGQLRRLDERHAVSPSPGLKGIFLTHGHIGHYTGLMHLGREAMGADQVPVYVMPRMRSFLEENGPWSQLVDLNNITLSPLTADSAVQLNERLLVTPFLVPHRDEFSETVGYRISGPEKNVVFIPDIDKWEKWDQDIQKVVKENEVLYLDGTFFANGEIPGRDMSLIPHPFVEESLNALEKLDASDKEKVFFIHFNHTNPLLQENSEARHQVKKAGFNIAEEGDILAL